MNDSTTILRAAAVRDAVSVNARPGAVAVRDGRIVAAGEVSEVVRQVGKSDARFIDLPDRLILPAMVNAHAHLDLTDIGPVPYEAAGRDFVRWIEMVMARRPQTEEAITAAVRRGLRMSREAGVGWLGDIAGSDAAARARIYADSEEWISGDIYLECFGIGDDAARTTSAIFERCTAIFEEKVNLEPEGYLKVYMQPHAPYSAGLPLYSGSRRIKTCHSRATHLHETEAEIDFIRNATGPFVDLLKRLGKWDDTIKPHGVRPIRYLAENDVFFWANWICAHCNYMTDDDIQTLAYYRASVAYCPIASQYFGHEGHRYRDMLAAGLNVCLGTDSILCQPAGETQPLGILPQMRRLYTRDQTNPKTLLEMATWRGQRAMAGGDPWNEAENLLALESGRRGKPVAIRIDPTDPTDPLEQALLNNAPAEPLSF